MDIFDSSFKEIMSFQSVSVFGGIITGIILAIYTDKILLIPGMLILLPGLLEMRGNISGALASRLSAGLFLGVVKPSFKEKRVMKENFKASFFLALVTALLLGFLAFLFNYFIMRIVMPEIILIPLITAIIANIIEIPLTLSATFYFFRKGHDPNNIMGPFVTSTGDVVTVIALLIALVIV